MGDMSAAYDLACRPQRGWLNYTVLNVAVALGTAVDFERRPRSPDWSP